MTLVHTIFKGWHLGPLPPAEDVSFGWARVSLLSVTLINAKNQTLFFKVVKNIAESY